MSNVALIFPGQGAQRVGMGKEFYESSPQARAIFEEADRILPGLSRIIFEGPDEKLTATAYCQLAILTASIAALKALEAHPKFSQFTPAYAAGLSLGEYSALTAAGALSFEAAFRLVQKRAVFMEEATKLKPGKMAAIIGFDKKRLQEICRETGAEVANYNSPDQIVITGDARRVEEACRIIEKEGAKNVVPLEVSGAFHSTLMQPAAEKFRGELAAAAIRAPKIPVITNVNAAPQPTPEDVRDNLARQITSSVQWEDSVRYIAKQGVRYFIEIGPGRVLKGLIRRIDADLKVQNVQVPADLEAF
jgi:[acyl-carrier-protein] S-malonyltransferase